MNTTTEKTTIRVNVITEEITMTQTAAKRVSSTDSAEYKKLVQFKRDFPDFKIKIIKQKGRENSSKGLSIELMGELIGVITNDNKEAIERFEQEKASYKGTNSHFSKPKAYFLSQYPNWRESLHKLEKSKNQHEEQVEQKENSELKQSDNVIAYEEQQRQEQRQYNNQFDYSNLRGVQ